MRTERYDIFTAYPRLLSSFFAAAVLRWRRRVFSRGGNTPQAEAILLSPASVSADARAMPCRPPTVPVTSNTEYKVCVAMLEKKSV